MNPNETQMEKPLMLITGATGFIGRNLVKHFLRLGHHEVFAAHHLRPHHELPGLCWLQADLTLSKDVKQGACRSHVLKVGHVVFFSCTVMLQSSDEAQTETDFDANVEFHPRRYFGADWTCVYHERITKYYARFVNMRNTIVHHSNVYGHHGKFDLERSHVFGATVIKVMTAAEKDHGLGQRRRGP